MNWRGVNSPLLDLAVAFMRIPIMVALPRRFGSQAAGVHDK